jgi:hypothetical protein
MPRSTLSESFVESLTRGDDDGVALHAPAVLQEHRLGPVAADGDPLRLPADLEREAHRLEPLLEDRGGLGVRLLGQQPREELDDLDPVARLVKVVGHLEPEDAAPDDRHPVATVADAGPYGERVLHRPERVDAWRVGALDGGDVGAAPRREEETVVGDALARGGHDLAGRGIHVHDVDPRAQLDAAELVPLGLPQHELLGHDRAGEELRQPDPRVEGTVLVREYRDGALGVEPPDGRGSGCARDATPHDDVSAHSPW